MSLLCHIGSMQIENEKNDFSDNKAMIFPQIPRFLRKEKGSRCSLYCDSVGIRTQGPQLRRLLLYPTELRNQHFLLSVCK